MSLKRAAIWAAIVVFVVGFAGCGLSVYAAAIEDTALEDIGWWLSLPMHVLWAGAISIAFLGMLLNGAIYLAVVAVRKAAAYARLTS